MKVTLEKLPASQVGFNIEIEGEKSQSIYDRMIKNLMQSANVPGFRKGKVPKAMLVRQFGSDKIKANVLEELLQGVLNDAISSQPDIQAIGGFDLGSSFEDLLSQFEVGKSLEFKAVIDVHPQVSLNSYKGLEVQAERIEPKLEQVEETLHEYQVKHSTLLPVEDRGAQLEDLATIDLRAVDSKGQAVQSVNSDNIQVDLNEDAFIPELVTNIVGMMVDEVREITIVVPDGYLDEDYTNEPLTFTVTLNNLKFRELPPLDDDFAQSISTKQTIAELREYLKDRIVKDAETSTAINADRALVEAVVAQLQALEIPATMIKRESKHLVEQQINLLTQTPEGEKLAKQIINKEFIQELVSSNEPVASDRIKRSLALAEIAYLENITIPRSEVLAIAAELKQLYDDKTLEQDLLNQIAEDKLIFEKVMAWLYENSTVEFVPLGTLQPQGTLEDELTDAEEAREAAQETTKLAVLSDINVDIEVAGETIEVLATEAIDTAESNSN